MVEAGVARVPWITIIDYLTQAHHPYLGGSMFLTEVSLYLLCALSSPGTGGKARLCVTSGRPLGFLR